MRSGMDHKVLPANHTTPAFTRSSPGGATTEWTVINSTSWCSLLLIYRPCEDERTVYPYKWLPISCRSSVQTSESSPIRDRRSTTEPPNQLVWVACLSVCLSVCPQNNWSVQTWYREWPWDDVVERSMLVGLGLMTIMPVLIHIWLRTLVRRGFEVWTLWVPSSC